MKKIILMACAILSLCSCSQTNEEKAKAIIEENLQKTMKDWSSYEFVEMTPLDSIFTLFVDTKEGKEYNHKRDSIMKIRAEYDSNIDFPDIYGNKRVKEMRDSLPILKQMEDDIMKEAVLAEKAYKGEFIGYRTKFTYRGNNSYGAKIIGKSWYFFDKDITKITDEISLTK
jgi:hypothetical protein